MAPAPLLVLQPQPHDVIGQRVDLWPWLPLQQILGSTADVLAGQHERRRLWPQECALGCGSLVDRFVAAVGSDKGSRGAILNGEQVNVVIGAPHHLRWSYCAARPASCAFVSVANGSRGGKLRTVQISSRNPTVPLPSLPLPPDRLGEGAGCSLEGLARGGPLGGRGPRGERRARTGELGGTRTREVGRRGVVERGRGPGAGQRGRAGRRERRGREPRLEVHGRGAAWLGLGLG